MLCAPKGEGCRYNIDKSFIKQQFVNTIKINSYHNLNNLIQFIEQNKIDRDIRMTYELLDWEKLDRLAAEIYHYEKVAAFGCDFSETAALDLQTRCV